MPCKLETGRRNFNAEFGFGWNAVKGVFMDQMKKISGQSRLVSEELKQQIAPLFQKMRRTVVLHAILDFEDEKSLELGSFLKAIASVNEQV